MTLLKNDFYFSLDIVKSGHEGKGFYIEGYAATKDLDRQGDIIVLDALKEAAIGLLEFGNTVFFNHDYNRAIGRLDDAKVDNQGLWVKIYISQWEEELRKKIEEGIISKFSIGGRLTAGERVSPTDAIHRFPYLKTKPAAPVNVISSMELFEVSVVGLPANCRAEFAHKSLTKALQDVVGQEDTFKEKQIENLGAIPDEVKDDKLPKPVTTKKYMETIDIKGVIPFNAHEKAPETETWDGPAEKAKADVKDLKVMCAWFDSEKPEIKGSYKLPHHHAAGYAVVWAGVKAAMGALLGSRGGVNIPESDKQGVHSHLEKHYKQFDKPVPELKNYTPEELKTLGFEEEVVEKSAEEVIKAEEVVAALIIEEVKKEEVVVAPEVKKEEPVPAVEAVQKQDQPPVEAVAPQTVVETVTEQNKVVTSRTMDPATGQMAVTQESDNQQISETIVNGQEKITETAHVIAVRTYTEEELKAIRAEYQKQLDDKEAMIKSLTAEVDGLKIEKANQAPITEQLNQITKDLGALQAKVKEVVIDPSKSTPLVNKDAAVPVKEVKEVVTPEQGFLKVLQGK